MITETTLSTQKPGTAPILALAVKFALIVLAFSIPVNLLDYFGVIANDHTTLINYAPEIWLTLLALVFGTLIIVVSIASENTPKLIDLFIGDPKGRLYIWLIMFSCLENIYLQLFAPSQMAFLANLIFINSYVLMPVLILLAIPYTYYILKYTKNANVIDRIYRENLFALTTVGHNAIQQNHRLLFDTVNQLHDLLEYIQFKEPKGDIIVRMGRSVRKYLECKRTFPEEYFLLDEVIRNDISFRTLSEKFKQIEQHRTFYEVKIFRVLGTSYLSLMKENHYELASLCGNELFETGRKAVVLDDQPVVDLVLIHFNTFLRHGINQGLKSREIRNVYNTIYHYSRLIHVFVEKGDHLRIKQSGQYLALYAKEAARLSVSDPLFVFMVEGLSWELKKLLVLLHRGKFPRDLQRGLLLDMTQLQPAQLKRVGKYRKNHSGVRLIQIALCLYYLNVREEEFCSFLIESILGELSDLEMEEIRELIRSDCRTLSAESEEFWEETDQGNRNIFYTPDKDQIQVFKSAVSTRLEQHQLK